MSKVQWEYDLVERPYCEQLKAMGLRWLDGDTEPLSRRDRVPEMVEGKP